MKFNNRKLVKVCGMKEEENIKQLQSLQPDFMGFIFYKPSPRNAIGIEKSIIKLIPDRIRPVGVFVNASLNDIEEFTKHYGIKIIQLHGSESPDFCCELKKKGFSVFKAFSIPADADENFFLNLKEYDGKVDVFLLDSKGTSAGGNGVKFNWDILKSYDLEKPFILSGGINPEDADKLKDILPIKCIGVDINSKFEISPGIKDVKLVESFIKRIRNGK